jgi:hypothetical protein
LTAGVLVVGELGRLVAVGRLEAADEVARSDGPDGAGCPPLQAVVTSTTTASIAKQRIDLISSGYGDTLTTVTTEPDMERPTRLRRQDAAGFGR